MLISKIGPVEKNGTRFNKAKLKMSISVDFEKTKVSDFRGGRNFANF